MASNGGASRDRTDDPLLAKQVLSQLSYGPLACLFRIWTALRLSLTWSQPMVASGDSLNPRLASREKSCAKTFALRKNFGTTNFVQIKANCEAAYVSTQRAIQR